MEHEAFLWTFVELVMQFEERVIFQVHGIFQGYCFKQELQDALLWDKLPLFYVEVHKQVHDVMINVIVSILIEFTY